MSNGYTTSLELVGSNLCNVNVTISPFFGLRVNGFAAAVLPVSTILKLGISGVALHSSPSLARKSEEDWCMEPTIRCHRCILVMGVAYHAAARHNIFISRIVFVIERFI